MHPIRTQVHPPIFNPLNYNRVNGVPGGIRTRVAAVKGRSPGPG